MKLKLTGILATLVLALALAPQAQARSAAKFKVLSLSGTSAADRSVAYEPAPNGEYCSVTQTERISFRTTKAFTAYAFTSRSHGRDRVEWSPKPEFFGNLVELEVPGEMTVSRTATYQQSTTVDPDTGETSYGCYYYEGGPSGDPPTDCAVKRTYPVTVRFGGTSDSEHSTYVAADLETRDDIELNDACYVVFPQVVDVPRLFSRAALFNKRLKRVEDTDSVESPVFENETGKQTATLAGELKRKKLRAAGR